MSTTTPAAAPAAPAAKKPTGYLVLVQDIEKGGWKIAGEYAHAKSIAHATRLHAEKAVKEAVTVVAVPARSWKPQRVTPQTVTKHTIEDVKA